MLSEAFSADHWTKSLNQILAWIPWIVSANRYFQPALEWIPIDRKSTRGADLGKNSLKGVKSGSWTPFTITLSKNIAIHSSSCRLFITGVNSTNSRIILSLPRARSFPRNSLLGEGLGTSVLTPISPSYQLPLPWLPWSSTVPCCKLWTINTL